jgi:predicted secreted protein
MIEHGYLPVKVADLDAVKFLVPPTAVSVAELSAVTEAVLLVIADNPGGIAAQELGPKLAELLLAARKAG